MSKTSFKHRRVNLMKEDPHCYFCRRELRMSETKGGPIPDDFPTLDHLNDRFTFSKRPEKHFSLVLACKKCNEGRSRRIVSSNRSKARWKSGAFPFPFRWFGKLVKLYRTKSYSRPQTIKRT